ncbi:MAG: hypothetical protein WC794_05305 [Candidatus Doudnabacteria bacterium]|jgi:hypothetical protein
MDDKLRKLMQELGNAINESLSDSDHIAEAIGQIKNAGYDVFLVLEATIGFNKREFDEPEPKAEDKPEWLKGLAHPATPPVTINWTTQDQKFLRALKIATSDDTKK